LDVRARTRPTPGDRGAVRVEMAILLPLLIIVVFGIIEWSDAYHDSSVTADAARAGGRIASAEWVTYRVPIPANYTCNYKDPTGCWTRVNFNFPNLTSVQDTTTWTAQIQGDPVRLIE
jgi:Flp pilus assembly protein TadG